MFVKLCLSLWRKITDWGYLEGWGRRCVEILLRSLKEKLVWSSVDLSLSSSEPRVPERLGGFLRSSLRNTWETMYSPQTRVMMMILACPCIGQFPPSWESFCVSLERRSWLQLISCTQGVTYSKLSSRRKSQNWISDAMSVVTMFQGTAFRTATTE
jgi:hypothetical protein